MSEQKTPPTANNTLAIINSTPANQIVALDFVKSKFVNNYNSCHKQKIGELVYARQCMFFQQALANNSKLASADKFSLYACFLTVAVKGWSLDPQDDEVYIVPRDGKAWVDRQAGAYVRRLIETGQIISAGQPVFVYEGDIYEVENGRVIKHVERNESEIIKAAYMEFYLTDGTTKFIRYKKSDWEDWRTKSPLKDGSNWKGANNQPSPGFLRTKIVKHACKEKCWASGSTPVGVEVHESVEIDGEELPAERKNDLPPITPHSEVPPPQHNNDNAQAADENSFAQSHADANTGNTIVHEDEAF